MQLGDTVARIGHGRHMMVVDFDGAYFTTAWKRQDGRVVEERHHQTALVKIAPVWRATGRRA